MPKIVSGIGLVYDTDNASDLNTLRNKSEVPGMYQVFPRPRQRAYGTQEAVVDYGLKPIEAVPDVVLSMDEIPDRLAEAHEAESLPIYHMYRTWRPKGTRFNQNGLPYCWIWSATGTMMTTRAVERKPIVILAPVSGGYIVDWRSTGWYLSDTVKNLRETGICADPNGSLNSSNLSRSFWSQYQSWYKIFRLGETWDTRVDMMRQHCASGLYYGRAGYIAFNWWSHALMLAGIRIVNGVWYWDISNSHNEEDVITLTGSRAIPDECIFFINTLFVPFPADFPNRLIKPY